MGDLSTIIEQLKLPTNIISTDILQEVLILSKNTNVFQEEKEAWNAVAKYLWYHLETGFNKYDDQLLCATCFYTVIARLDSGVEYLNLIKDIIQKEITAREDRKNVNTISYTISLVYGIFQSSFLIKINESYFENNHVNKILQASFDLLIEMAFDYSRFTFIVFKCLSLLSKLNNTKFFNAIFTQRNQIKLLHAVNNNWENPITGVRVEYASPVWNPQYDKYISRIEKIQKKFLRYLDYKAGQRSRDYFHRCKRYHFLPLSNRRNISDICYLTSILKASIDCPDLLSKLYLRTNLLRFRDRAVLHVPPARTRYRSNSFFIRVCRDFRTLSTVLPDIDLFISSNLAIKRQLTESFFLN